MSTPKKLRYTSDKSDDSDDYFESNEEDDKFEVIFKNIKLK